MFYLFYRFSFVILELWILLQVCAPVSDWLGLRVWVWLRYTGADPLFPVGVELLMWWIKWTTSFVWKKTAFVILFLGSCPRLKRNICAGSERAMIGQTACLIHWNWSRCPKSFPNPFGISSWSIMYKQEHRILRFVACINPWVQLLPLLRQQLGWCQWRWEVLTINPCLQGWRAQKSHFPEAGGNITAVSCFRPCKLNYPGSGVNEKM